MSKIPLIISLILVLLLTAACSYSTVNLRLKNQVLSVDIASDYVSRSLGLSGRQNLAEDRGMVFVMGKREIHNFWMGGMNFPLDVLYIDGDEIVEIFENVPIYDYQGEYTRIHPSHLADKVLELKAGWCVKHQVQLGDQIELMEK